MRTARPGPVKASNWNTNKAGLKGRCVTCNNRENKNRIVLIDMLLWLLHPVSLSCLAIVSCFYVPLFVFKRLFFVDTVNDRVGFGLMDAKKMVDLAVNWTTVPPKVNCTIPLYGVNR